MLLLLVLLLRHGASNRRRRSRTSVYERGNHFSFYSILDSRLICEQRAENRNNFLFFSFHNDRVINIFCKVALNFLYPADKNQWNTIAQFILYVCETITIYCYCHIYKFMKRNKITKIFFIISTQILLHLWDIFSSSIYISQKREKQSLIWNRI